MQCMVSGELLNVSSNLARFSPSSSKSLLSIRGYGRIFRAISMVLKTGFFAGFVVACSSCARADLILGNTVFIGDSITEAQRTRPPGDGTYSWRYAMWKRSIDSGDTFRFVGSRTSNYNGPSTYPTYSGETFENRHEAIWGTTSLERADTLAPHYGDLNRDGSNLAADTAFILLGTNDIGKVPVIETRDQVERMVDGLRSANGEVNIFLLSIPPLFVNDSDGDGFKDVPWGGAAEAESRNAELAAFATSQSTQASRITFVDIASSLQPVHLYDGIHPNAAGEEVIGNLVYAAVVSAAVPEPAHGVAFLGSFGLLLLFHRLRRPLKHPVGNAG